MIQANELRIGNYVTNRSNYVVIEYFMLNTGLEGNVGYTPIPLTPEILEKCGFTYSDLNCVSGFWQIKHPTAAGLIEILEGESGFWYNYQSEIKHLHQLQNLYFALTGEELELNL